MPFAVFRLWRGVRMVRAVAPAVTPSTQTRVVAVEVEAGAAAAGVQSPVEAGLGRAVARPAHQEEQVVGEAPGHHRAEEGEVAPGKHDT